MTIAEDLTKLANRDAKKVEAAVQKTSSAVSFGGGDRSGSVRGCPPYDGLAPGLIGNGDSYPDGNPKTQYGVKKAPLHLVPPIAVVSEAKVFELGARKYNPYNWREKTVSSSVYYSAALRHLMAWWDGESADSESGESHLSHARACLAILLDADSIGRLNDDRPIPGRAGSLMGGGSALDGQKGGG